MSEPIDKQGRQRRIIVVGLWVCMLLYAAFVPGSSAEGIYQCPFHKLTGYDCPGCGMTRASVHVLHFDLLESFQYHPFGVVFVVVFTGVAVVRFIELLKGHELDPAWWRTITPIRKKVWFGLLVLGCLYGFGRLALEIAGILTPL